MTSNDNTPSVGYAGHVGERLSKDYFMTLRELRIVRKACGHMGLSFHQIAARGTLRRSLIECVDAEGTDAGCESWALLNN